MKQIIELIYLKKSMQKMLVFCIIVITGLTACKSYQPAIEVRELVEIKTHTLLVPEHKDTATFFMTTDTNSLIRIDTTFFLESERTRVTTKIKGIARSIDFKILQEVTTKETSISVIDTSKFIERTLKKEEDKYINRNYIKITIIVLIVLFFLLLEWINKKRKLS